MIEIGHPPPPPDRDWAFFFDVDGTIAELAPSPSSVRLDPEMRALLARLHAACGGALALVSGRSVADVDVVLGATYAAAGQHGLERRDARGTFTSHARDDGAIAAAAAHLGDTLALHPALSLEQKGMSLALHYRRAPGLASLAHRAMRAARQCAGPGYMLQQGKCVVELLPNTAGKGGAIRAFMQEPPFRDRTPVFVGDDLTDESGFAALNRIGGYSVKVGGGATIARWRLDSVAAVTAWLRNGADAGWTQAGRPAAHGDNHSRGMAPHHITVRK